jgi:mannitol/fructose-specific phosphotransferase system IIA component
MKIEEMLGFENIVLNLPRESRESAIRRCGRMLYESGYVTERYVEGMFARDRDLTTAIGSFIAIPHGTGEYRTEILATGFVVLTYPDSIDWGGVPVNLVIGIAAAGGHQEILENIASNLNGGDDVIELLKTGNKQSIYNIFCR